MCILLVEDEWITCLAAETALTDAGYEVLPADHGQHAFKHLDANPGRFTCLVTDFYMPGGVTGAHVVERVRPEYPSIPIILATATSHVVTIEWRLQHAVEMLLKPYEPHELVTWVGQLLRRP